MSGRLDGKVTIVTGGNSGIGEATSHLFAREGAKVILMARREEQGIEVQNSIRAEGGEATFIQCDVADVASVEKAVKQAAGTYDSVDILFNNAGHGSAGDFPESTTEEWNNVINVNLNGTFYVSRAVWPHIVSSGGGAIVNMSSLAAQRGFSPRMHDEFGTASPSYYAAKAGVEALTRYMSGIGGKNNIRVNCVRPGQILTRGEHHAFKSMFDFAQIIPGPGYPIDVGNLVLFLVSEDSRFITGEIINIDGGVAAKI